MTLIEKKYLTPKDIGDHLQIGRNKVYKLCALKGFPAIRIGAHYRVDPIEYEKWLDGNKGAAISIDE